MFKKAINQFKRVKFKELGMSLKPCMLCGWNFQVKTHDDEMGVRCTKCGASAVTQSMGKVFKKVINGESNLKIYELSSRGSFVRFLNATDHDITLSEYFDDVEVGEFEDGVMCQDVQNLTFADNTFDVCTSLEVFEHVENDAAGFKEVLRVLKPGGLILLTVPLNLDADTVERTQVIDGNRVNILPEEYHSDSLRGINQVFCYRNYGLDIVDRLRTAGFKECKIFRPNPNELFGLGRPVVFGQKPN